MTLRKKLLFNPSDLVIEKVRYGKVKAIVKFFKKP